MIRTLFAAGALALAAAPALADDLSLGVTGGTLGVGPQVGWRGANVGVRGDATFLGFSHGFKSDDLRYDGHAHLRSAGAVVDLYPFGGGFRLSGGARWNRNRANVDAMPTQDASVGGMVFTPDQIGSLSGRGTVRRFAPTAGLGWGSKPGKGLFFAADAGALFQGRVRVSDLTSSTGLIPQDRLETERQTLQRKVDDYHVYPVAQLAIGWRF